MKKLILLLLLLVPSLCFGGGGVSFRGVTLSGASATQSIFEFRVVSSQTIAGVFSSTAPITVDWGDGTRNAYNGANQAYSKDYGSVGNRRVIVYANREAVLTKYTMTTAASNVSFPLADLPSNMTTLYMYDTASNITGTLSDLQSNMTHLWLYSTASNITGTLADLPSGLQQLYLSETASNITGTLADLPSGLQQLYLRDTASNITGALSDLPSNLTHMRLDNTASNITGGAVAMKAKGIRDIRLNDLSLNQTVVNGIVDRLYTDMALFTFATPILYVGGTNVAPSGTPQIDTYIPALRSDGWTIDHTAP